MTQEGAKFDKNEGWKGHLFFSEQLCHRAKGVLRGWWYHFNKKLVGPWLLKCCCFFKTWGYPLRSKACSVEQKLYGPASITQAFVSVRKLPAEPKTVNHCVWTRPANKDNLSALSSFPLSLAFFFSLLRSNIYSSSRSTHRGSCARLCHTSVSLQSRAGAGWHRHSPLFQVHMGTPIQLAANQQTLHAVLRRLSPAFSLHLNKKDSFLIGFLVDDQQHFI